MEIENCKWLVWYCHTCNQLLTFFFSCPVQKSRLLPILLLSHTDFSQKTLCFLQGPLKKSILNSKWHGQLRNMTWLLCQLVTRIWLAKGVYEHLNKLMTNLMWEKQNIVAHLTYQGMSRPLKNTKMSTTNVMQVWLVHGPVTKTSWSHHRSLTLPT